MTLQSGTRLGPYEIVAPLGAGGMGEVYRARDSRLGREVALKVLPQELSEDRDRLSRFEQEARSASALNHPNIVTVHDIGRADSTSFIAMELVDGQTLRELAASGPMPTRRILAISTQIAEGLAKAHAAGIVHRDLKPENVMVSRDGFVKILDFGLAKLVEPESGEVSVMPTLAKPETHPGVVMGTVAYMSPEQASGAPIDFRSDQFSLGSILYEVATGERPFQRKTAAETMSAIIREEVEPIGRVRPEVPAPLRWIVDRCLAKDPEERYASTRDLARELASVRDHVSEITGGSAPAIELGPRPFKRARRTTVLGFALLILLLGAVAGWLVATGRRPQSEAPRFRRLTFRSGALHNARFTPDGQTIVYGATWVGEPQSLYAVRPESPESRSFGIKADVLAVSSTGEMAVLLDQNPLFGTLARVPFAGGVPRRAVEAVPYASADWSPDGKNLAVSRYVDGQTRLEFPLGNVLYDGHSVRTPRFDPNGGRIAFFQREKTGSVMMIRASGGDARVVASGFDLPGGAPCWTPGGREIWFTGTPEPGKPSGLYAADLEGRLRLVAQMPGELELDDISRDGRVLLAHHTIISSMRGVAAGDPAERDLTWLDLPIPADISADGKSVLFTEAGEGGGKTGSVYLRRFDGSSPVRLGDGQALALTPDGESALVALPGVADRFLLLPVSVGEPRTIAVTGFETLDGVAAFLPGGKEFVFSGKETGKRERTYRMGMDGGKPRPIGPEGVVLFARTTGPVSPDGNWLVGTSGPRKWLRIPIEGGEAEPVVGLEQGGFPIRWASAGSLWVRHGISGEMSRLDVVTGRKTPAGRISPPDATLGVSRVVMSLDGRTYVYSALRAHSLLYVVDGLK